jgi:peptidyl-tRNA hydrolase, PTH1 family
MSEEEAGPPLWCIAGLGNPGPRYEATPHNIGFRIIDELAQRHAIRVTKSEGQTLTGSGKIRNRDVVLVKPQTFMNLSGAGISPVLKYRNLTNHELIVVHDELDLPWTALRIKRNGSAAGHNGVKSIIAALKTDVFIRVRVGIRPDHPIHDAAEYVLAPFERSMKQDVDEVVSYTADAVESIVAEGANRAMAKFNRRAQGIQEEEK